MDVVLPWSCGACPRLFFSPSIQTGVRINTACMQRLEPKSDLRSRALSPKFPSPEPLSNLAWHPSVPGWQTTAAISTASPVAKCACSSSSTSRSRHDPGQIPPPPTDVPRRVRARFTVPPGPAGRSAVTSRSRQYASAGGCKYSTTASPLLDVAKLQSRNQGRRHPSRAVVGRGLVELGTSRAPSCLAPTAVR